jgi:dTDP-4-dehydrorhamnose 3,5-epimerase-like enzyme
MANLINLKTFTDERGNLTVIEKIIPFEIKRVFYIYGVDNSTRGHHRHKKTIQAAISIQGSCTIWNKGGDKDPVEEFILNTPSKCLIINSNDYHWMDNFSKDCILMVFASEYFDPKDYIYEKYND